MNPQDYTATIHSRAAVEEIIEAIDRVDTWWTSSFKGAARKVGDTFNVRFGGTLVDFQVVEHAATRIVWRVTDSLLPWLKNTTEWTGTEVVWELSVDGDQTRLQMTHKGLLPQAECYENCEKGWNFYVSESLRKRLLSGEGLPDGKKRSHT